MITLAFDSTAKVASVALTDGERALGVSSVDAGLTQSEILLPMAEHLLKVNRLSFADVEMYACCVGPGSFTGVRIGVATVKGLAFGKDAPCIGVSTLEALAENLRGLKGTVHAVMDARRGQVYHAAFSCDGKTLKRLCADEAIAIDELLDGIDGKVPNYLVGDGTDAVRKRAAERKIEFENTPALLVSENAYSCAVVANRSYENGVRTTDRELAPVYLRLPQAERERLEKAAQNS